MRLLARVTNEGYMLGATDNMVGGSDESYWSDYYSDQYDENEQVIVEIEVPQEMVQALLDHGTSGQVYSDGYEAWDDVLKKGKVINGWPQANAETNDSSASASSAGSPE